jgi:hypothetical protein
MATHHELGVPMTQQAAATASALRQLGPSDAAVAGPKPGGWE